MNAQTMNTQTTQIDTSSVVIMNTRSKRFDVTSETIAAQMLHCGNPENFNRAKRNLPRGVIAEICGSSPCVVKLIDIHGNEYKWEGGRVAAKRLVKRMQSAFGIKAYNLKKTGKLVEVKL